MEQSGHLKTDVRFIPLGRQYAFFVFEKDKSEKKWSGVMRGSSEIPDHTKITRKKHTIRK